MGCIRLTSWPLILFWVQRIGLPLHKNVLRSQRVCPAPVIATDFVLGPTGVHCLEGNYPNRWLDYKL